MINLPSIEDCIKDFLKPLTDFEKMVCEDMEKEGFTFWDYNSMIEYWETKGIENEY